MAEITDTLRLDIDQALRDVNRIEQALDIALAPVEVKVEVDATEAEQLEGTLREIERIAERATTETADMALAAGRAEANFEDLARALGVSEDEARRLTGELLEAQAAGNRLEDAARDVARQLGLSDREAERLSRSLREADRAAEAIDVSTIGLGARFAALRSSAVLMAGALAGLGGTALFGAALTGANAAIQSFARLEDSINAVKVVFAEASAGVLTFGESAAQSAGLSQEAFNQAVAPIGGLLQNFGFDAQEAAQAAVILVQRGADLASVYGGSVQDALLAVGAALRGEADPLERYSASISAARVEAFALANGLAATKAEITPAITLQARYGLILQDTNKVAGDYVANVEDLANAQKSAGAELQNFVTDIGQDLAPALETILVLVPEVVEGLRQLVPAFAAGADSAAAFFESVGEGGGFRTEFAGIAAVFDSLTAGAGFAKEGVGALISVFKQDFQGAVSSVQRGGALIEQSLTRSIGIVLANALDKGTDSTEAFTTAIRQVAQSTGGITTFTNSFRDFAIAADLTDLELRDITQELINSASAMGFTADEVDFLTTKLAQLNSFLFEDIEAVRQFNLETRALGEEGFATATTRFTTFATDTKAAADAAAVALSELAAAAEAQAARTADAFNLFEELPENLKGSFTAAVDALREQVESIADFEINIALLRAFDLDALADDFEAKGVAAAAQLAQAVNNIPASIEADLLLQGLGVIGEEAFDALVERFVEAGITPADVAQLKRSLASPEVIDAAEEAARLIALAQAGSYHDNLTSEFDQLIPGVGDEIGRSIETHWRLEDEANAAATATANSYLDGILDRVTPDSLQAALNLFGIDIDLTEAGIEAGATFIDGVAIGVSSASAAEELRGAITSTIDDAIFRDSPPKLFLDIGKESGDAFWSGFNQADLTLRLPTVPTGGLDTTAIGGTAGGGGVNVSLTTINPIQMDEVSDTARMGQIASSIAASYRSVVPNGM